MRFSFRWLGVFLCLAAAGCKDAPEPNHSRPMPGPDLRPELERRDARIKELEQELEVTEVLLQRKMEEQAAALKQLETERKEAEAEYFRHIELQNRQIAELKAQLEESRNALLALERPSNLETASPAPEPVAGGPRLVTLDTALQQQTFPVRIFEISGTRVETGSHTSPRAVETDEEYKDAYGNVKKKLRWEDVTVPQYGYEVRFSAQNLTDREQSLLVRAGLRAENLILAPEQTLTNLAIRAARGSSLLVIAGTRSKSFDVTY